MWPLADAFIQSLQATDSAIFISYMQQAIEMSDNWKTLVSSVIGTGISCPHLGCETAATCEQYFCFAGITTYYSAKQLNRNIHVTCE